MKRKEIFFSFFTFNVSKAPHFLLSRVLYDNFFVYVCKEWGELKFLFTYFSFHQTERWLVQWRREKREKKIPKCRKSRKIISLKCVCNMLYGNLGLRWDARWINFNLISNHLNINFINYSYFMFPLCSFLSISFALF